MPFIRLLYCFLLIIPICSCAEIFYWEDANGQRHYSDRKRADSTELTIQTGANYHAIKKIIDGDTLVLENGTKVRLLGINTPEVSRRDKVAEAGGVAAKKWLIKKLAKTKVKLRYDVEKKDAYGRELAYVFTDRGENINVELVKNGLAAMNIYPPNLKYLKPLWKAQQLARTKKRGIWGLKAYKPKKVNQFDSSIHRGWQRIHGKVKRLKRARKYDYLYLSPTFSIKIAKTSAHLFRNLDDYVGEKIEVHGWVRKNKQKYTLLVRHPSAIIVK
ncbi:MAG: thermonuclease family protein [Methylococcales bacterium]|nr:thermonuclease family protein [Methylococcales bacterium]